MDDHTREISGWRFRIRRDKQGRYRWHLVNPAGTALLAAPKSYPTAAEARAVAEQMRAQLAEADIITNGN